MVLMIHSHFVLGMLSDRVLGMKSINEKQLLDHIIADLTQNCLFAFFFGHLKMLHTLFQL